MIVSLHRRFRSVRRLLAGLVLLTFCAPGAEATVKAMTGRTLNRAAIGSTLPMARFGDDLYAEVNSEWLKEFYRTYRAKLSKLGVVRWDQRYDCRRFAGLFTELAQNQFFNQSFHSDTPADTLALGPVWYLRADGRGGHAIVVALTERGTIYLDPQNGEEVHLTAGEKDSIYFAVL